MTHLNNNEISPVKVIYVSFSHLTDRIARDYYIDYIIEKGATVEFWDIISLVREEHNEEGMIDSSYLRKIRTYNELEENINLTEKGGKKVFYVMILSHGWKFNRVYKLLSKYNCRMLYVKVGGKPTYKRTISQKLLTHLFHPITLTKILFDHFNIYVARKLKHIHPYEIFYTTGKVTTIKNNFALKMVPINIIDFDHFKRVGLNVDRLVKERYAVYLDTYMPHHNDHAILGRGAVKEEIYYAAMNNFFKLLEKKFDVKVIIAAHPTARYKVSPFKGREIYRLLTAELVKDSEFVISDVSTSTSYAVLNQKRLIFIYTNEMISLYKETMIKSIHAMSTYLDSPVYNISKIDKESQVSIKDVNKTSYENYKYNFLTSPQSENTTSQEIFWREITSM
jgi:hypothetical protein